MYRSLSLCLTVLLLHANSSLGQSPKSGLPRFASSPRCSSSRLSSLSAPELYSLALDNQLKEVKLRYEIGVAIAAGRAEVKIAKLREAQRISDARYEHAQLRRQASDERRIARQAEWEEQRRLSEVDVDLSQPLQWPEALRRRSLAVDRTRLEEALGEHAKYVKAGDGLEIEEVRNKAAAMFGAIRPLRDELGDRRLIEAKRYLEGLVRAAEAAAANRISTGKLAAAY